METSTYSGQSQATTNNNSNTNGVPLAPEFGTWPVVGDAFEATNGIRHDFNDLLTKIQKNVPAGNERYLALARTKLEEACMFTIKAIAKPTNV